ncbi:rhamnogalacturonan acetylesterase RgaE [Clavulina sp. PMI_390]|nr:rhamnogalacturonan acetylesterase RgaE [Clavulina sp. PMI_390]
MISSVLVAVASLAALVRAAPTIYMAGDSTMVATGNNDGTVGWGLPFASDVSITVVNDAVAGRSARSYTREGRFTTIANSVKSGDYVIIEFGHNDGGSLTPTDNGRTDCPVANSNYATTCSTTYGGVAETVLTYPAYYENAAKLMQAKGANVILCPPTIDNPWETGSFVYSTSRFVQYASDAAAAVGATFVNHELYVADIFKNQGAATVDAYFPIDHTHTSAAGAAQVARAFVLALEATSSTLKNYLK